MIRIKQSCLCFFLICILCGCGQENVVEEETLSSTDEKGRQMVTLDIGISDNSIRQMVEAFNNSNPDYFVEIIEYEAITNQEKLDTRALKIMTGRCADIICLDNDYRTNTYIKKGVLENIADYVSRDLKADEYVDGIFDIFADHQKIYAIPVAIRANLLLTKAENGQIFREMSFNELKTCIDQAKPNTIVGMSSKDTLWRIYNNFNVDPGNTEQLTEAILLSLPIENNSSSGRLVLGKDPFMIDFGITTPDSIYNIYETFGLFGEDVSILNSPTLYSIAIGISSASSQKEGAWEFIKYFLGEECQQKTAHRYLPVNKKIGLDIIHSFYEKKEDDPSSYMGDLYLNRGLSEEVFVNIFTQLISKGKAAERLVEHYDEWRLLEEEIQAYYEGERELDDVLKNFQKRLKVYRLENEE